MPPLSRTGPGGGVTEGGVARGRQLRVWWRGDSNRSNTPGAPPEYLAVDGCSRASVVRHALVVREPLFVDDFPAFVDHVLLVDVEQGNQGVRDA